MKVLMALTSHDKLGNIGRKTSFCLEEGAVPYCAFRDAGVELTLASPKGGQPPIVKGKRVTGFANEEEAVCLRKEGGSHVLHAVR